MGSSKSSRGPGSVAGAEQQGARGPGKGMEQRAGSNADVFGTVEAASGKGIKPSNRTRGHEEDGA